MLEGLLHHKKEEKEYLCALVVSEDRIDAALWETSTAGKTTVLKVAQETYTGEWEQAIDAADRAITAIEQALPQGAELTTVVFGLYPEWLVEDHSRIKDEKLKQLKQLTTSLSLTPIGFVELPTAISFLLQSDEGTQQTVILVGVESKHVTVSLFKIGKLIGSFTSVRTESLAVDIETSLGHFSDVEVLPSRMLLFGTQDLEALKTELLNFPWQKKANFLHIPKIEVLPSNFPVTAVATASSTELTPHETHAEPESEVVREAQAPAGTADELIGSSEEVSQIAEDLGFVTDRDVAERESFPAEVSPIEREIESARESQTASISDRKLFARPRKPLPLPRIKFPQLEFTFKFHRFSRVWLVVALVIFLLFLGGGGVLAYWIFPKATVNLLVSAQVLDKTQTITVDTAMTSADLQNYVIPGKVVSTEVTNSKTIPTTGTKTVGEKAKGEVTIYNKILNTKTFKKGTILTAGNLEFTLEADVTVASASEGVGSLTYGSTKAEINAADIGTTYNVSSGTEFAFEGLPTTSYSARNDSALSGGASREVKVVARDDYENLRDQATVELEQQAASELTSKLGTGEKLIDASIESEVKQETFSQEISGEADQVSVEMVLSITGLVYQEADFLAVVDQVVSQNIPINYEYRKEEVSIDIEAAAGETAGDSRQSFSTHMQVKLLPKLETTDLAQRLAGQKLTQATDFLSSQQSIAGVEFDIDTPLSWMKDTLPPNPQNITIQVSTL